MNVDPYLHDLYTSLLKELKVQLQRRVSKGNLGDVISKGLTRKLVKKIYMPLVYGKSQQSAAQDIFASNLFSILPKKECTLLARFF